MGYSITGGIVVFPLLGANLVPPTVLGETCMLKVFSAMVLSLIPKRVYKAQPPWTFLPSMRSVSDRTLYIAVARA